MSNFKKWAFLLFLGVIVSVSFACAGFAEGNSLHGVIWNDVDSNGVYDSDEKIYADATVFLQQRSMEGGNTIDECHVNEKGEFSFNDVPAGEYRLKIVTGGYAFTTAFIDSQALPAVGTTGYTDWENIDGDREYLIGVVKCNNAVRIIAYEDEDSNGGRRKSEKLIRGVHFTLLYERDGQEYELASINSSGNENTLAEFHKVTPGKYRMRMDMPEGYASSVINKEVFTQWYNAFPPTNEEINYTGVFEVVAREDIGMCAALVPACEVSGKIWDSEHNEPLENAIVTLGSNKNGASFATVTDANGEYHFMRVGAGEYELTVQLPDGKAFAGEGLELKSVEPGKAACKVTVKSGKSVEMEEISTVDENAIMISAYFSAVSDSISPDDVSFSLLDWNENVVRTGSFDESIAKIRALSEGNYFLSFGFSDEYVAEVYTNGASYTVMNGQNIPFTVEKGVYKLSVVFAKSCSVSGCVFEDLNNDGEKSEKERFISGLTVTVVDQEGNICGTGSTGEQGEYIISGLMPGEYKVRFVTEDPYIAANAGPGHSIILQTPDYGETASVMLNAGDEITGVNGAVFCAYSISGHIDVCDERLQPADGSAMNVKAVLYNEDGTEAGDFLYDISNENGDYTIKGVLPGDYYITYTVPQNYLIVNPAIDGQQYSADVFSLDGDIEMPAISVYPCAIIKGTARHGTDPVGFTIELRGTVRDNLYVISANEEGCFEQSLILPDTYKAAYSLEEGYVFGEGTSDMIDSMNARRYETSIEIGTGMIIDNMNIDAVRTGTINGYVYYDYSGDGDAYNEANEPFNKEYTVYLMKGEETADTAKIGANGHFVFTGIIPGEYQISLDADSNTTITSPADESIMLTVADGDQNVEIRIGLVQYASVSGCIWNVGESKNAISGIHVFLYNDYVNGPVADCFSDENGCYLFEGMQPGNYYLAADLPDGYLFARSTDAILHDSFITYDQEPAIILLKMGTEALNCDIGIGAPGGIGDYAWLDVNGNGLFDIGEPQMPGIRIEMYSGDELVAETYSDEYGYWKFSDLYPGEYMIKVYMPSEVKTTVANDEFRNINSILPQDIENVAEAKVLVPSNGMDLACDLGFVCIEEGVLPETVKELPTIDWSYNGTKRYDFDH